MPTYGPKISPEAARKAVADAWPVGGGDGLAHIGSGWDFDAFRTQDGWVFRFPRHPDASGLLRHEARVLDLVRRHLPPSVTVPRLERWAPPTGQAPHGFAGHRYVPGVPIDSVLASHREPLAADLGLLLGALHAIPIGDAREAGLTRVDHTPDHMRAWFEGGVERLERLGGTDPVVDTALAWIRALEDPLRRLDAPVCVIHQDLSPDHILCDPGSGRVTGVIDWADATLGDPARDFVILVAMGGWPLAEQVLKHYSPGPDTGFVDRLRFLARLLPSIWLGEAHAKGEDVARHLTWVRNAFGR